MDPQYQCIEVKEGESWSSLWPNAEEREKVRRINRMNIRLRKGIKIAVPNHLGASSILDFSPFSSKVEALGKKFIQVDLSKLAWAAYDSEGTLLQWGPASGGKSWCPDIQEKCVTPPGKFSILYKQGAKCKSGKFPIPDGGAPMPYCMFFRGGFALHGSDQVPDYNASHGCVRLFPEDAKWLNENFIETPGPKNAYLGTQVIIQAY